MLPDRTALGLLLLRASAGLLMLIQHGLPKLLGFSQKAATFSDPLGLGSTASLVLAVFAEVFCALFVVLGLGTRIAAVPLVVTMLVAAFVVHAGDPFAKKELALLYAAIFSVLILTGPGAFSVEARWRMRVKPQSS